MSGAEAGDIFVNAPVSWAVATTLTLTAHGSIYVNAPITASNAAGKVALQYGQGAIAAGNTADYYVNAPVNLQAGLNFSTKLGSDGTTLDYRVITALGAAGSTTGTDLQGIGGNQSGRFVLGADINASATSGWNAGAGFEPINFTGTFDGLGHAISGLVVNRPSGDSYGGLFGSVSAAVIRNVGLEGGSVTGGLYAGGLVGVSNGGSVTRSYSTANVTGGNYVGGLVGYINNGSITQSYATGNVSGSGDVGGLVGRMFGSSTIFQSYATGNVSGADVGGLVGTSQSGSITQSYATGQVTGSATGGLISSAFLTTIAQSYWDTQTSGQAGSNGGTGLTTAQMKTQSSFTGWDFVGTWRMTDGSTYPLLTALSKSITGTAYSDAGVTNVGSGVGIQMAANGLSLGSTTTAAGGTFQFLVSNDQANGLLWIDNGSAKGNTFTADFGNTDLWGGYVRAGNGTANSIAAGAKGSLSDTDILFTSSGNNLTLATNTKFLTLGAYTLDGNITAQGTGTLDFSGAVTLTANSALTTANQTINFGSSIAGNYGLTLAAGTGNITTHAVNTTVNVGTFRLDSGNWSQNSTTLPSFVATDFQFAGGTFLRVKGGNGTTATPYQITDVYGLQGVASSSLLTQEFQLANDIAASATSGWNAGTGFSPIGNGNSGSRFAGRFDGLGYTINGLVINRTGQQDVGLFGGSNGTVQNVGLVGGNMAGGDYTGALVGRNYGAITRSFSTANVTSNGAWVGGLVGAAYSGSIITQSYATGNVAGQFSIGGLVGLNSNAGFGSSALIQQSYATGSVSGSSFLGGLVGQSFSGTTITQSYATGGRPVLGSGAGTVTNSYSVGNGITLAQLEAAVPAGFDSTVWGNAGNHSTPYIEAIAFSHAYVDSDPGTTNLYRIIQNVDQLQLMSGNLAERYALGNNIDASATSGWNGGLGFAPLGNSTTAFTGKFDGLGSSISSLVINRPAQDYVGLFGYVGIGGTIRNVGLLGGTVSGHSYVGDLAGVNQGSISRSYATGSVTGTLLHAGGLVGSNLGSISQSYAMGSVAENFLYSGGLVGSNFGDISQSYATGSVAGIHSSTGGLVGANFGGSITSSFWDTETTGQTTSAGGIGKTTAEMKQLATFSGWDISSVGGTTSVWRIYEGDTAPLLRSFLRAVTASVDAGGSKVYDGTTAATGSSYSLSDPLASPGILGTATYVLDSSNVGNRTATLGGLYSNQQGYDISFQSAAYTIDQRAITLSTSNVDRGYDGTTDAAGTAVVTMGTLAAGDSLGTGSFTFDNKNVGTGKTVVVNSVAINDGNSGNNYLVTLVNNTDSSISAASLTVTAQADSRGYNGTTGAAVDPIVTGMLYDAIGTNATQVFDDKNVGTGKTLTASSLVINDGNSGNNYAITYVNDTTGEITAAALTVTAQTDSRGYDGTNGSTVGPVVTGTLYDAVSTAATQTFDNKNAGSGKTLTAAGLVIDDGNSGNNYAVTYVNDTTGEITEAALTVTAQTDSRGYDGTNGSTGGPVVTGTIFGQDAVDTAATQSFDNKKAGTGKTLTAAGLVIDDGNNGDNYAITYVTDTTGKITAAGLTVTAQSDNRVYDGTRGSSVAPVVTGTLYDAVTTAATQAFDNKNAGTGKTLSASGLGIDDGNNGGNYAITYVDDTSGVITQAGLTVTANSGQGKIYGNVDPVLTYTMGGSGLFGSDTLSGALVRVAGENVNAYAIKQGSLAADSNYSLTFNGDLFAVTPRSISVRAGSGTSIYGKSAVNPGIAVTGGNLAFADTLDSLGLGNDFDIDSNTAVGNYQIFVTGSSSNYQITRVDGNWKVTNPVASFSEFFSEFQSGQANDENDVVDGVTEFHGSGTSTLTFAGGGKKESNSILHISSGDVP